MGQDRSHHQTYVLTCDLSSKMQALRRIGLKTPNPDHQFYTAFREGMVERIEGAIPGITVKVYDMQEMSDGIMSTARNLDKTHSIENGFIVSTCVEIAAPSHGYTLEANRIIDGQTGKVLGIGPRPGFPSLETQVRNIISMSKDKDIVIVEDGSFTGSTLCHLTELFRKCGKPVSAVVVGLAFGKACERIAEKFDGNFIATEQLGEEVLDWIPDHDFTILTPNSGRVVGHMLGDEPVVAFNKAGRHYSVPYLIGYAPSMADWASIEDKKGAYWLSTFCIDQTAELYNLIGEMNGCRITMKHLSEVQPPIGIPYSIGGRQPDISKDEDIVHYLKSVAHELD